MVYLQEEEDKVEKPSCDSKHQSTQSTVNCTTRTNNSVKENRKDDISVDVAEKKKEDDVSKHQSSEKSVESCLKDAIQSNEECTKRENPKGIGILMLDIQNEFAKEGGKLYDSVAGVMEKTGMLQNIPSVVAAARYVFIALSLKIVENCGGVLTKCCSLSGKWGLPSYTRLLTWMSPKKRAIQRRTLKAFSWRVHGTAK